MTGQQPDRLPAHFEATGWVWEKMQARVGVRSRDELLDYLAVDIRNIDPSPICSFPSSYSEEGRDYTTTGLFGEINEFRWNGIEYNEHIIHHPLDDADSYKDIERFNWPDPAEIFDYSTVTEKAAANKDKALIFGHWGPFQTATTLRSEEKLYMDMALNPDLCRALFDRMHAFEMDHYTRIFEAGGGEIDILRTHDDYGTQRSLLFSMEMWQKYFREHTKALADLAHSYGAFFQQHSCGAVAPIIPELIKCGVDALEPIQPVDGMEPETLAGFGNKLCFAGGIDTQHLLPFGTIEEVTREVERYRDILGRRGGYILYPSQAWESAVPLETIEAFYRVSRVPGAK